MRPDRSRAHNQSGVCQLAVVVALEMGVSLPMQVAYLADTSGLLYRIRSIWLLNFVDLTDPFDVVLFNLLDHHNSSLHLSMAQHKLVITERS